MLHSLLRSFAAEVAPAWGSAALQSEQQSSWLQACEGAGVQLARMSCRMASQAYLIK